MIAKENEIFKNDKKDVRLNNSEIIRLLIGFGVKFSIFLIFCTFLGPGITFADNPTNIAGTVNYCFGTLGKSFSEESTDTSKYNMDIAIYQTGTHKGKTVAVGSIQSKFKVMRFNTDGSIDTTFATASNNIYTESVSGAYSGATNVIIQSDGKIVTIGYAGDTNKGLAALRLNSNGTLDTSFGVSGKFFKNWNSNPTFWYDAIELASGDIISVGHEEWYSGIPNKWRVSLAKFSSDGTYDSSFGLKSIGFGDTVEMFEAVGKDGSDNIYAAGRKSSSGKVLLAKLNAAGTFDASFGTNGLISYTMPDDVSKIIGVGVQSNGRIILATTSNDDLKVLGFKQDGSGLDTAFGSSGITTIDFSGATDTANDMIVQSDNKIVLASTVGGSYGVSRLNEDGSLDTSFSSDGKSTIYLDSTSSDSNYFGCRAIAETPDVHRYVLGGVSKGTKIGFALVEFNDDSFTQTYLQSTVTQNENDIGVGSIGDVVGLEILTCGNINPLSLSQINANSTGSINTADITTAKMYYTEGTSSYSQGYQFGDDSNPGSMTFNGTQSLANGYNYFWLAYAIPSDATKTNVVDGEVTGFTASASAKTPTVPAPSGSRTIGDQIIYSENFGTTQGDCPTGWTCSDEDVDGYNWTTTDINGVSGRSGVCAASESYDTAALTPDNWLISPAIDLSGFSSATLKYYTAVVHSTYPTEKVTSYYSTTTPAVSAFTNTLKSYTGAAEDDIDWITHDNLSLTVGGTIYLAFRHHDSTDQWAVRLDDIIVSGVSSSSNNTPTNLTLSSNSIAEGAGANATVGTLSTTDADGGDSHTYTLVDGLGNDDNASFNISGTSLRATNSFVYATKNSYTVRIQTDDGNGGTYQEAFKITVTEASGNNAPTDISLDSTTVAENSGTNSVVGNLTTTDADGGDTHTYSLVPGTGSTDNASFNINASQLRANDAGALAEGNYSVRIKTDDGNSGTFQEAFSITVLVPTWTGTDNWTSTGNWNIGTVPTSTMNPVINTGTVTISASTTVNNLTIDSGPQIVVSNNQTLTVNGTCTIKGTYAFSIASGSSVILNGNVLNAASQTRLTVANSLMITSNIEVAQ